MPSFIGSYKINSNTGILNNGDAAVIAPNSSSKTYSGAGGGVTGDLSVSYSGISITMTNDPDVMDSRAVRVGVG
jgi:hypothetical protein